MRWEFLERWSICMQMALFTVTWSQVMLCLSRNLLLHFQFLSFRWLSHSDQDNYLLELHDIQVYDLLWFSLNLRKQLNFKTRLVEIVNIESSYPFCSIWAVFIQQLLITCFSGWIRETLRLAAIWMLLYNLW